MTVTNIVVPASELVQASELSDLELLSQALREAQGAYERGLIVGPAVDELQLERAARRARQADAARLLTSQRPAEGAIA